MSKLTEVINSLNDENASEIKEQLLQEATAMDGVNRQLHSRAKKAEGFKYDKKTTKWVKKEQQEKPKQKSDDKSDEPNYAKLAFLEQRGVNNSDDQQLVQDEAKRLDLPLTDILGMEHIKSKLKTSNEQREAESGMPKGRGKAGGTTQNTVDYHLAKGTTPDDLELAEKVISARENKETNGNKFADDLY